MLAQLKILFSSYLFDPSIGGLESVSKILAAKFAGAGNDVHVITESSGNKIEGATYRITRRPSLIELLRLLRWCDLFFQNNISLRSLIPALLLRKPTVVVHQTWLQRADGRIGWQNRFKQFLIRFVTNVAISKAVADRLSTASIVINNPYDDAIFGLIPNLPRDKTIAFLGRLVSDKGTDVLLHAIRLLKQENLSPDVAIVGAGPEEPNLRRLADELGLDQQVTFLGKKTGTALVEFLNHFRVLVVPSRLPEPFGVVALEGIACGCVVVGSDAGGLREAIGPCGVTFQNGDAGELAGRLKDLLVYSQKEAELRGAAAEHLKNFRADAVAAAYLTVIKKVIG